MFRSKQHLRGTPQGIPLTSQVLLSSSSLPPLPQIPLALLLPLYTFRFKLADDAFFLKHPVQNFARGEAASFLQRGMLHFLVALAFVLASFVMLHHQRMLRGPMDNPKRQPRRLSQNGYGLGVVKKSNRYTYCACGCTCPMQRSMFG